MRFFVFCFSILLLLSACSKEKADHINIFAENMNGDSKVWVDPDPTNLNNVTWVLGESIDLNNQSYDIKSNGNGSFSLDVTPLNETMYAIYPATTNSDGDDIEVTNNNGSASTVTLNSLAINFLSTGGHNVVFPMESQANAGAGSMKFNHLTGGLRLTLFNPNTTSPLTLSAVKVVLRSDQEVSPLGNHGVTATWAVQGPTMPSGEIGGIEGDQPVGYSSEMYFVLQNTDANGTISAGATIVPQDRMRFCVPVTVSSFRYITVIGYNMDGSQRFTKSKDLGVETTIERNKMYTIPEVVIPY